MRDGDIPMGDELGAGYRKWAGDWADSGAMALTGMPGEPPTLPPGSAATLARELTSFIARGAPVSSPLAQIDGHRLLSERAAYRGGSRAGQTSVGGASRILTSVDGHVVATFARPADAELLSALVGRDLGEGVLAPTGASSALSPKGWELLTEWIAARPAVEFAARAELLGLPGGTLEAGDDASAGRSPLLSDLGNGFPRSVDGAVVLDFSGLWAGPLCAHLLGLAGARVIKVETPGRPDGARLGNKDFYELLHAGHESVVVEPDTAQGRAQLAGLVERADIVIESSRPRALAGLGLDAESLAANCTWISITAAGRSSSRVGFGDDIAASAGLLARHGGGAPMFVGDAIADPLTGIVAAAYAMSECPGGTAGTTGLIDLSMLATVAGTLQSTASPELPVPPLVVEPQRRPPAGSASGVAPESGAHTDAVLSEMGLG